MRRTGLSYNAKVQPLLKHGIKRPEPELDAPPLSTDESEGEDVGISLTHRSSPKKGSWLTDMVPGSSSDIEGDERNRKANIAPTKFGSKRPSPDAPSYGTRKSSKRAKLSDDESISSKSSSKGNSSKRSAASSSARHLKDEHGFITTRPAKSTYGKRNANSSDPRWYQSLNIQEFRLISYSIFSTRKATAAPHTKSAPQPRKAQTAIPRTKQRHTLIPRRKALPQTH